MKPQIMIEKLSSPQPEELDALTALWEASVRATHHFAAAEDIDFYRPLVRSEALPGAELYVIRGDEGGFSAFMGIEGEKIEMLFVAPHLRGKGLGRELVQYGLQACGVRRVDVNEQNQQAVGFYARMGFWTVSRDELDPQGKPFPILHLKL